MVSKVKQEEGTKTYQLHLVLNREEFVLGIKTGVGAIRKLEDDHVARDEVVAVELIDKASWHIRLRLRKLLRLLEDDAQAGLAAMTNDGSDAVVAAVLGVTSHVR